MSEQLCGDWLLAGVKPQHVLLSSFLGMIFLANHNLSKLLLIEFEDVSSSLKDIILFYTKRLILVLQLESAI